MSSKGGYQIIDLKNVNLSTSAVTVPGIFNAIMNNNKKRIVISGLKISNVSYNDIEFKFGAPEMGNLLGSAFLGVNDAGTNEVCVLNVHPNDQITARINTL